MPRPSVETILDLSDLSLRKRLMTWVGTLTGLYELVIRPKRNLRSMAQHRWYFAAIVTPFGERLSQQDYRITRGIAKEVAHGILNREFLTTTLCDPDTGRPLGYGYVRSTTSLTSEEMSDYCDRARAWLLEVHGIETLEPEKDLFVRAVQQATLKRSA